MMETGKMTSIKPFQAWRYNSEKTGLADVIAPPYDIISPAKQEQLYHRSEYNCVRLILNRIEKGDGQADNRYTRAKACFEDWKSKGILIQDSQPSIYFYRQTFPDLLGHGKKTRTAILFRLKLESFEKGNILPHEKTLDKPKQDRRKLLETAQVNFSPIFCLYRDPGHEAVSLIGSVPGPAGSSKTVDDEGVEHDFSPVSDSEMIASIQRFFSDKKIYIADGHHRYQTALEYAKWRRQNEGIPEEQEMPYDYILAALVSFEDPGLAIYPTHREVLTFPGFDAREAVESLKDYFEVHPMKVPELKQALDPSQKSGVRFGLLLRGGESFYLEVKDAGRLKEALGLDKPEVWYQLDVNILGHLIFSRLWKLKESDWEKHLRFTHDYKKACQAVTEPGVAAVFILQPPQIGVIEGMCEARELMPQKSTYFFPKLATGFVFYQH